MGQTGNKVVWTQVKAQNYCNCFLSTSESLSSSLILIPLCLLKLFLDLSHWHILSALKPVRVPCRWPLIFLNTQAFAETVLPIQHRQVFVTEQPFNFVYAIECTHVASWMERPRCPIMCDSMCLWKCVNLYIPLPRRWLPIAKLRKKW